MTSSKEPPTGPRKPLRKAALGWMALALGALAFAGCGGGGGGGNCPNDMCPTYDMGTGKGWCAPGPNDCQLCKTVVCPGYCVYNGGLFTPVPCSDGGQ